MAQPPTALAQKTSAIGPLLATTLAIFGGLFAAVAVNAAPTDPSRIAAVFPPWWSPSQTVAAAGGASFIIVLRGDPSDLARRARSAGALIILDPDLAGLCAPKEVRS